MRTGKLFHRDFTMVVLGQIVSLFGNGILRFALPLYLLRQTGSAALYGAVSACSFVPMVIFSILGGGIADRVNKRNIMVVLDFCTAALIGVFYVALGKMPLVPLMLAALMMLYGIQGAYQPAVQASIPLLAEEKVLMKGNAVINMVSTLSGLLGPVIGGVLYGRFGIRLILEVSIVCFAAAAVMETFIQIPHEKREGNSGLFAALKNDFRESSRYVRWENPALLQVILVIAVFNLVFSAMLVVGIPVIVINVLEMSDARLGVTQGAMGLGGLAGGILAGAAAEKMKIKNSHRFLLACAAGAFLAGLSLLPGVSADVGYWVITGVTFGVMCVSTVFTVMLFTLVQRQTPANLLGKIMAVIFAVANCSQPVGQAIYGGLFEVFGNVPWVVLIGAAVVSGVVAVYAKGVLCRMEE